MASDDARDAKRMRRRQQKTAPPNVQAYRGPNHVLVSRRSSTAALRARVRKLLSSGRWEHVHIHGLGASLGPAIALAAELVEESGGRLEASASTSTEVLVDQPDAEDDADADGQLRHNSAVHVRLSRVVVADGRGGPREHSARGGPVVP